MIFDHVLGEDCTGTTTDYVVMTTNPTIEIAETREQCTEPNADYEEQWDADFGCKCMY